ncbi:MAG: hypothetical protein KHY62_08005 [Firmicutes bacterium]|nr:hypothetical protein [Bacillota bacterium]
MNKIDKIRSVLKQSCMGLLFLAAGLFLIPFVSENILGLGIEFTSKKRLIIMGLSTAAVLALVCAFLSFIKRKDKNTFDKN